MVTNWIRSRHDDGVLVFERKEPSGRVAGHFLRARAKLNRILSLAVTVFYTELLLSRRII